MKKLSLTLSMLLLIACNNALSFEEVVSISYYDAVVLENITELTAKRYATWNIEVIDSTPYELELTTKYFLMVGDTVNIQFKEYSNGLFIWWITGEDEG